jgi:hypothetical protein
MVKLEAQIFLLLFVVGVVVFGDVHGPFESISMQFVYRFTSVIYPYT